MRQPKNQNYHPNRWSILARIIWFGSTSVDIGPAYVNNWTLADPVLKIWVTFLATGLKREPPSQKAKSQNL